MRIRPQRILSALVLACLLPGRGIARASGSDGGCHFSVLGGATRCGFAHDEGGDGDYRLSTKPSAGVVFTWPRTRGSAIEAGAILEGRGGSWFSGFAPDGHYLDGNGFERRLDLAYLLLPIRIRAGLPAAAVTPSVHAGIEIARRLWARETTRYRESGARYGPSNHSPGLTDWDVALAFGGRLTLGRLLRSPFLEVTYSSGLGAVGASSFGIEGSLPHIKNRGLRVMAGVAL